MAIAFKRGGSHDCGFLGRVSGGMKRWNRTPGRGLKEKRIHDPLAYFDYMTKRIFGIILFQVRYPKIVRMYFRLVARHSHSKSLTSGACPFLIMVDGAQALPYSEVHERYTMRVWSDLRATARNYPLHVDAHGARVAWDERLGT